MLFSIPETRLWWSWWNTSSGSTLFIFWFVSCTRLSWKLSTGFTLSLPGGNQHVESLVSQIKPAAFPRDMVASPALHSSALNSSRKKGKISAVLQHIAFLPWGTWGFVVQKHFQDLVFYSLEFLLVNQTVICQTAWRKEAETLILEWKMYFRIESVDSRLIPCCVLTHTNWWHNLLCGDNAKQKWAAIEAKVLLLRATRESGLSSGMEANEVLGQVSSAAISFPWCFSWGCLS